LLIKEKKENGYINLKYFWIRRALRIWPLYYFIVFFGFVLFPILKHLLGQESNETANPFFYLIFANNFDVINKGLPDASMLGVLWSVAIEEQFYFVWPIILIIFPLKKLWIPFFIIILSSLIFRAYYDSSIINEFHTLSCICDMTIGGLGAWLILSSQKFYYWIEYLSKNIIISVYIIFCIIFFFRSQILFSNYEIRIFERLFISILIIIIILEQTFSKNSFLKISRFKRISKLGKITYGLYCLHFIGILMSITITKNLFINEKLWEVLILETSLALLFSVIISKISYKYYETPFLKLKEKFTPN
jgi:peptidoglycan/LPS O-acetylase OafA/YrhL